LAKFRVARNNRSGRVKITVVSSAGKEAVLAMLGPHDFFGEGALVGQSLRMSTATTLKATTVFQVEKRAMLRAFHDQPPFASTPRRLIPRPRPKPDRSPLRCSNSRNRSSTSPSGGARVRPLPHQDSSRRRKRPQRNTGVRSCELEGVL
jgi:hypothetical protein